MAVPTRPPRSLEACARGSICDPRGARFACRASRPQHGDARCNVADPHGWMDDPVPEEKPSTVGFVRAHEHPRTWPLIARGLGPAKTPHDGPTKSRALLLAKIREAPTPLNANARPFELGMSLVELHRHAPSHDSRRHWATTRAASVVVTMIRQPFRCTTKGQSCCMPGRGPAEAKQYLPKQCLIDHILVWKEKENLLQQMLPLLMDRDSCATSVFPVSHRLSRSWGRDAQHEPRMGRRKRNASATSGAEARKTAGMKDEGGQEAGCTAPRERRQRTSLRSRSGLHNADTARMKAASQQRHTSQSTTSARHVGPRMAATESCGPRNQLDLL